MCTRSKFGTRKCSGSKHDSHDSGSHSSTVASLSAGHMLKFTSRRGFFKMDPGSQLELANNGDQKMFWEVKMAIMIMEATVAQCLACLQTRPVVLCLNPHQGWGFYKLTQAPRLW